MNEIQITAKLHEMSETAKRFYRKDYESAIAPYVTLLKEYMQKSGKNELEAVIVLVQLESVQDNAMAQMLFFAAAVHLINNQDEK